MKDIMGLMKQAQAMQAKMATMQESLDSIDVEGQSGGGMVKVVMSAKGLIKNVTIDPSLMNVEEKEILEDLIVAACNDAKAKGERIMQEQMQEATKGLPLPPGLKLF